MSRGPGREEVTVGVAGGRATLMPDPDRRHAWTLVVDGTPQSHVDLDDPTDLAFEYTRRIGHVIDLLPAGPVRAVHLGGGGMTLARYVSATRPRSRNLVVEVDGPLIALVRAHLPWPRSWSVRVRNAGARPTLAALPSGSADLIVLDAFSDARTPGDLTSVEAFAQAARVLDTGGTFVANIADGAPLDYARRFAAGVSRTFGHVLVAAEPSVLRGRRFGNLVVVARALSAGALDVARLTRLMAGDPWPARTLHGEELRAFVGDHAAYEDATAPGSPGPPPSVLGR